MHFIDFTQKKDTATRYDKENRQIGVHAPCNKAGLSMNLLSSTSFYGPKVTLANLSWYISQTKPEKQPDSSHNKDS